VRFISSLTCAALALAAAGCSNRGDAGNEAINAAANAVVETIAATDLPDPASPAAAKAMVERYAALAEKREFASAADYWTDATAAAQFAHDLEVYPKVVVRAGEPADMEGAAGSSFITVPVTLDLTLRSGAPYQMNCAATLRRVNDVPGATPKQLRWNIQSIDC
jgi:uncharacterized lipoprotein NlpE involved in copper resistance